MNPSEESLLFLIGGEDEEELDSTEVLSQDGTCYMVEGIPAPLPQGRLGHVATAVENNGVQVRKGSTKILSVIFMLPLLNALFCFR